MIAGSFQHHPYAFLILVCPQAAKHGCLDTVVQCVHTLLLVEYVELVWGPPKWTIR